MWIFSQERTWTSAEKSAQRMDFYRPGDGILIELAINAENVAFGAKKRPVAGLSCNHKSRVCIGTSEKA
jgi:hypothetical protein